VSTVQLIAAGTFGWMHAENSEVLFADVSVVVAVIFDPGAT